MLRKNILLIIVLGLLMALFPACQSLQKPAGQGAEILPATIIIEPMSGPAGKTALIIYGAGFSDGENVRIILGIEGTDIALAAKDTGGVVRANSFGAFVMKPRGGIPRDSVIKPGIYTVKAIGDKGSMASAPLQVEK